MPSLYDYRLRLQRPAVQVALKRLIDFQLAHREVLIRALRAAATMITDHEERRRMRAALEAIEASAGDEGELRKVSIKLRAALAQRKRALKP